MTSQRARENDGSGAQRAGEGPRAAAGTALAWRVLAVVLLAAPTVAHLVHRDFDSAWVLVALFATPLAVGRRDPVRAVLLGLGGAFLVPLLPIALHVLPFASERVLVHGTLAALVLGGHAAPRAGGRLARWLRWTVGLGAAWSVAAGARGVLVALPEGAPWVGEMIAVALRDLVVDRSQVEAVHPLAVLCLRLEYLALLWLTAEVAAGRADFVPRLVRTLAWSVALGVVVTFGDILLAANYRGEDLGARLAARFPRNHRPLVDNNALGTALVAMLPVLIGGAAGLVVGRRGGARAPLGPALAGVALAAGLFLLVTSRSKAALGAFAVALPLGFLVAFGLRRATRTWWLAGPAVLLALVLVGAQLVPVETAQRLAQNRYLADAIRVVRLDAATAYLRANRSAPWGATWRMGLDAPVAGQGLGRVPARLADFRDADLRVQFNPRHENAHNQVLQSFAEEGALGVVLLLVPFGLATLGARAGLRRRRGEPGARDWPAVAGLMVVPPALLLNLQVGHALLENSVAYIVAILFGAAVAQGGGTGRPLPARVGRRGWVAAGAVFVVGLAPALWAPRPPLAGFAFGCFPWVEWPHSAPDRLLSPDARWLQVWGNGPRLKVQLRDGRPSFYSEPLSIDVWLDGELAVAGWHPPRPAPGAQSIPVGILRVDGPAGVREGDLVEVRLVTTPAYAESLHYGTGRPWIGPRMGTPFFRVSAGGE